MQRPWILLLFLAVSWPMESCAETTNTGQANGTLLTGQISGVPGDVVRNLTGMILSMNVFHDKTILHSSLRRITNHTFPLNYSVQLSDSDFKLVTANGFSVVCMVWQAAYFYEGHMKLPENKIDMLDLKVRSLRYVTIHGSVHHAAKDNDKGSTASNHTKLELIEDQNPHAIIDQIDFVCASNAKPCPFEYRFDAALVKPSVEYRLQAVLSDRVLPPRKSTHEVHAAKIAHSTAHAHKFKVNPDTDTVVNNYDITVNDSS